MDKKLEDLFERRRCLENIRELTGSVIATIRARAPTRDITEDRMQIIGFIDARIELVSKQISDHESSTERLRADAFAWIDENLGEKSVSFTIAVRDELNRRIATW